MTAINKTSSLPPAIENLFNRQRNITLESNPRRYTLSHVPEASLDSCTQFIGKFFEKFDNVAVAQNLIDNNPKYQGMSLDELLGTWQAASDYGSKVHEEIEHYILNQTDVSTPQSKHALDWLENRMPSDRYKLYPEVMVYSEKLGLAGTIDLLAYDTHNSLFYIVDWKTNKRINQRSFNRKKGILPPTQQLDDCHYIKYGLQLSLYSYILETEYQLNISKQALVHLMKTQAKPIACAYAKGIIENMLTFHNTSMT